MNERGSEYVPVVDAIIIRGRDMVVEKGAKTFSGPYLLCIRIQAVRTAAINNIKGHESLSDTRINNVRKRFNPFCALQSLRALNISYSGIREGGIARIVLLT